MDHPTLSFSDRVQKSVLYICVSFSVLHIGLYIVKFKSNICLVKNAVITQKLKNENIIVSHLHCCSSEVSAFDFQVFLLVYITVFFNNILHTVIS